MAVGSAIIAGLGLGLQAYTSSRSLRQQEQASEQQAQAIADAEARQEQADLDAEQKRLESLAAQQTGANERIGRFDFGVDSAAARQPTAPSTIATSTTDEDDDEFNPFYARGLV